MRDESIRAGLASRDPKHPHFTAISWVVLQEIRTDVAAALLRLELLRCEQPDAAITRAVEMLRLAVSDLDSVGDDHPGGEHPATAPTG